MINNKKKLAVTKFDTKKFPSFIQNKIDSKEFKRPLTKEEKTIFWKENERLFKNYAYRLCNQYNRDQEDMVQQTYILVCSLLDKYQPAFPCDVIYSKACNSKCKFWKSCNKQEFFGWQTFKVKPYLFYNIYHQMRWYAQKNFTYDSHLFNLDFTSSDDTDETSESIILKSMHEKRSLSGTVERKLISEILEKTLDDVIDQCKQTKKQVAIMFFKQDISEKKIHEILNKSQSTINTHISAIKKQVLEHPNVVELKKELEKDGISISDILND